MPTTRFPSISLYLPHKGDVKNQAKAERLNIKDTSISFKPCSLASIGMDVKTRDCPSPTENIVKNIQR